MLNHPEAAYARPFRAVPSRRLSLVVTFTRKRKQKSKSGCAPERGNQLQVHLPERGKGQLQEAAHRHELWLRPSVADRPDHSR